MVEIPEGKLRNVADLRDAKIAALADRVQVTFYDSEREDRPTVDIRDFGIGIKAEEFATTILSLHRSRKLRKLFLAGAFGQGGSTALAYSQYTLIVSRPSSLSDDLTSNTDELGFTIVRFNSGDPETGNTAFTNTSWITPQATQSSSARQRRSSNRELW